MKEKHLNFHGAMVRIRLPEKTSDHDALKLLERFQDFQISNLERSCAIFYSPKEERYRFVTSAEMAKARRWGECIRYSEAWG